ncbi:helix-turn-helix domain-containing protein [Chitinophaga varians]|uniref:helix-turn-helix domain-containing protein n=1 Tax=Chitinophaga varians TaxID=2202339 RepID=UPI001FECF1FB|nr:helix-turn-helix domain-containing protein [Chitinophaga varians]
MTHVVLSSIPVDELKEMIAAVVNQELTKHLPPANQSPISNDLLTRKEAARLLGISLPTLLDYTKLGKITGYRLGTRVRYKRSELEQALTQIKAAKLNGGYHGKK